MISTFKDKRCEVEFQADWDDDNRGGFVCCECLLAKLDKDNFDGHAHVANRYEALKHLQAHVAAGHMVPQALIVSIQQDLEFECLVHQSAMSPLRRHDGTGSANRERAFHDQWNKEQYSGCGSRPLFLQMLVNIDLLPMAQRDATIAATLIQWLGTNVGFSFMEESLKRCGYKIVNVEREKRSQAVVSSKGIERIRADIKKAESQRYDALTDDDQSEGFLSGLMHALSLVEEKKDRLCPECGGPGVMFNSDLDWCPKCKHQWPGT